MPSLPTPPSTKASPSPSPFPSPDGRDDVALTICAVAGFIWCMVAAIYTSSSVLIIIDERRDTTTADESKVRRAPRTRFTARVIWAVLKGLLWPLVVLWELVDMIVTEWCVPWWCSSTCDTTDCFRKCADACEVLSREPGDLDNIDRGMRGMGRQTAEKEEVEGVVRSQPSKAGRMELEVLPTYLEATMPAGLSERKGS